MPSLAIRQRPFLLALITSLFAPAAMANPVLPWLNAETRGLSYAPYFLSSIQAPTFDPGSNPGTLVRYGHALALDGDWLLVGAPNRLGAGGQANGAVFLYQRQGVGWVQRQRILYAESGARCGHAVAMHAGTAVVGCPAFTSGGLSQRGRALIYRLNTASAQLELSETLPGGAVAEQCGHAVAVAGTGLANNTYVAVGCPGRGVVGAGSRGGVSVHRLVLNLGGLSWQAWGTLSPESEGNPQFAQWRFGAALAMERIDGATPLARLMVGMPGATPGETTLNAGLAFIFERPASGGSWEQVQRLSRPGGAQNQAEYGFAVSLSASQAVVGAPGAGHDASAARSGMAYRYRRFFNPVTSTVSWIASGSIGADMATLNPSGGSRFGHAVALSGNELWVGQPVPVDQESRGAVWRYRFSALGSEYSRLITDIHQESLLRQEILGTELGFALSVDGRSQRIAVGAPESAQPALEIGGLAMIYERSERLFSDRFSPDHLRPGAQFRDCESCPTMVMIPRGSFTQGSPVTEPGSFDWERPQRLVTLPAFAMGQTPVTFAQWDACVADGGCLHVPDDGGEGRGDRPVVNVNIADVQQYLSWLNSKTGKVYRLPSESEWEYAARAGNTGWFPTGNCIRTDQANFAGIPAAGCSEEGVWRQRAVPVSSFAPNAFGLYDLHGNAWDWVADCWNTSYVGAPVTGSAWMTGDCSRAVLRGGFRNSAAGSLRFAHRDSNPRDFRSPFNGFRVVRSVAP